MKYQYKIQWLFTVAPNLLGYHKGQQKDLISMVKILGARSLDKICLRDSDLNVFETYTGFISFRSEEATKETIKFLRAQLKNNKRLHSVELYRK